MMKTTAIVAAAALAAAPMVAAASQKAYITKRAALQNVQDDCTNGQSNARVFTTNAYGQKIVYIPENDSCIDLTGVTDGGVAQYTEIDAEFIDACFVKATPTDNVRTFVTGGNKYCPIPFGTACTTGKLCRSTWTAQVTQECPTENLCVYPTPTKVLKGEGIFPDYNGNYPLPGVVSVALGTAVAINCPVYDLQGLFSYVSDKSGKKIYQGWAVKDAEKCNAEPITTAVQTAVHDYNVQEPGKYPVDGRYWVEDAETACFIPATGRWSCRGKTPGCTISCPEASACDPALDQCGGVCAALDPDQPDNTVCTSSAIASAVIPAVAAALALVFF